MRKAGSFTLPGFGTFRVVKTKARKGLNSRTSGPLKIKEGKTVRFKAALLRSWLQVAPDGGGARIRRRSGRIQP
jgi:nucleoid DNA-binding protein